MELACKDNIYDYKEVYGEIKYKASKWDSECRVVVKIEKPESQNGFAFDSMSSTEYIKLQLSMLAYNFNNWFRRLVLSKYMKSNRIETIRLKIVKIAAKIINSSRYLTFKLCSSCPYKNEFGDTLKRINNLAISP